MKQFDLEEERVKQEIFELKAKRILVQLPEGLKPEAPRLARTLEKIGTLVIVSVDPCYGACDLAIEEAESLGADLLVHYGHSRLERHERVPTIYVEARGTVDVKDAVQKCLPILKNRQKIGLTTTVQHVQTIDDVKELLLCAGKTVVIGDSGRLNYPGQVIGCDYSNAKSIKNDVEAFLFVGGGQFHALGVALSSLKPTVVADPYEKRAYSVDEEARRVIKQRWASIEEARTAKTFAVLIGLKPGQKREEEALSLKKKLEEKGRTAYLFAAKEITPEAIMNFPLMDAFVNTACPRISLDNASKFQKPVLMVDEALVAVGELSWEELCRKGLFGNEN